MRGGRVSFVGVLSSAALLVTALLLPPSETLASRANFDGNPARVRIGIFGLFHPAHLTITAVPQNALLLRTGSESTVVESSSGVTQGEIKLSYSEILATVGSRVFRSTDVVATGRNGEPVDFQLAIPGKITRRYHGTLEVRPSGGELVAIVAMDLETAVVSIVGAEITSDAPVEAMKAQAVATRSYLVSGRGRHSNFDFCDTTHCQFLSEPPKPGTPLARAVDATRGLVLAYNSQPFPAMYTRSCSGHTRTPSQVGLRSNAYPYFPVDCKYCLSHPAHWTSRIPVAESAVLETSNEGSRLKASRRMGWNTIPSNDFIRSTVGQEVVLHGTGYGHGIGLCQAGAKAMAGNGASFRDILAHYYPNTSVVEWKTTD